MKKTKNIGTTDFILVALKKANLTQAEIYNRLILPLGKQDNRYHERHELFVTVKKELSKAAELHGLYTTHSWRIIEIISLSNIGNMKKIMSQVHALGGHTSSFTGMLVLEGNTPNEVLEDMAAIALIEIAIRYAKDGEIGGKKIRKKNH